MYIGGICPKHLKIADMVDFNISIFCCCTFSLIQRAEFIINIFCTSTPIVTAAIINISFSITIITGICRITENIEITNVIIVSTLTIIIFTNIIIIIFIILITDITINFFVTTFTMSTEIFTAVIVTTAITTIDKVFSIMTANFIIINNIFIIIYFKLQHDVLYI